MDALTVEFGGLTALDDVGLTVGDGEVVALIGPNGAGKTTVFNVVCGLVRPRSGSVRIDGRPAPATSRLADRGVSRTLQGLGLFGGMTAAENVLVPLTGRPRRSADGERAVVAVLQRLDLLDLADTAVDALPYPERKRVALARALVTDPRLLLLDEPAGGLGADDIAALADVVRGIAAAGTSVLLVEHHVDFVMAVADRVVVLDFGRVVACGTPDEVRSDAAVEAAYLGLEAAR
ncbi:ABC transporter ATP-binding protein [Isoptericola cucumis]|uniref:ABC transporter ATP-binding protein n=1 Tax=Isoptericola cucumis TaxID=1776856 RepID=A0ABQ2B378_9MICO|nr:ATP-binding cassette domain-containing protein [Isoptericola cucumis]GGI06842.1 ABC transporter ATP-binding protein [Isoptericola cucumis]